MARFTPVQVPLPTPAGTPAATTLPFESINTSGTMVGRGPSARVADRAFPSLGPAKRRFRWSERPTWPAPLARRVVVR